ncbi:MAG TPA: bifunctional 4-hydroxy-2-oxoglutarate aldolase/2-dehydro-3-deoxy-phosphogluconate aldolase [Flavisolibacter sp.]|jgi:2-dehydro-3-deoxyphosphogluconate aldolase/(4S)-4-hydroxy-2-oxoglutarate aldolase|nr:bifunctional 4-hydroxy-2-oxoglutarate aldolase/2-dehydro-3-deoxy-phosphogluconate aldolase [Flavisolibacter sp.]
MNVLSHILHHKLVAIIRGVYPDDVLQITEALYQGGIRTLEITLNSPDALSVIGAVAQQMQGKVIVGAGTVLDAASAKAAISSGAEFIISPSLDIDTIQQTKSLGKVSIPGALTPTEIFQAYKSGGDIIKVFPASAGVQYMRDLKGPFPQIPLMPTGGISIENIQQFHEAGAVAFGIGSTLVNAKEPVTEASLEALRARTHQLVQAVYSFSSI